MENTAIGNEKRLDDIVVDNGIRSSVKSPLRSRRLKTAIAAGAIYLASLAVPITANAKDYRYGDSEPKTPSAALHIGVGAGIGAVVGFLNYNLFGKPVKEPFEDDDHYKNRCSTRFWLHTGISTGVGAVGGGIVYSVKMNNYNKDYSDWKEAQNIDANDANDTIPPGQFATPCLTAGVSGNNVYLGISVRR